MSLRAAAVSLALLVAFLAVGWVLFSNPDCDRSHPNRVFCPANRD